jgi:hypothetical protein
MPQRPRGNPPPDLDRVASIREEQSAQSYLAAFETSQKIQALGGQARVSLARRSPEGEWAHIRAFSAQHFELDKIAEEFGGGHYRALVYGTREDGSKGWLEGMGGVFDIEGEPKIVVRGTPAAPAPVAVAVAPTVPASDPMVMATRMTEMIMSAVTAALGAMRPREERDPIETLRAAKELFAPATPIDATKLALDSMREGMKAAQEMEGGGDSYAGVIREAIPVLGDVARAFASQSRGPERPALPPGPPPAGPNHPAVPASDPRPLWLRELWPYLPLVANLAAAGFDAGAAASQLLAKLPDAVYENVAEDSERDGFVNRTLAILPNALVAPHGPWLTAVLAAMQAEIAESNAEDAPASGLKLEVHDGTPPGAEEEEEEEDSAS